MKFPASREEAIIYATENGAADTALDLMRALPEKDFQSIEDINDSLGKMRHVQGEENIFASRKQSGLK